MSKMNESLKSMSNEGLRALNEAATAEAKRREHEAREFRRKVAGMTDNELRRLQDEM
jgi:hypothetical protein